MKIIPNKGSELEQTVKEMYNKMVSLKEKANELVTEAVGVKPVAVKYRWGWGELVMFVPKGIEFNKEDIDKINPKVLRYDKTNGDYSPSLRNKEGKAFDEKFRKEITDNALTDEPLKKYGINTIGGMKCGWCVPFYEEDKDRYVLSCSDTLAHMFDNSIEPQYTTEFEKYRD